MSKQARPVLSAAINVDPLPTKKSPLPVKQGSTLKAVSPEVLDIVTEAYREAVSFSSSFATASGPGSSTSSAASRA